MAEATSTLRGVIEDLELGEHLARVQIWELERLLELLTAEGWSGFIPADEALQAIVASNLRYEAALREIGLGGIDVERAMAIASRALEWEP